MPITPLDSDVLNTLIAATNANEASVSAQASSLASLARQAVTLSASVEANAQSVADLAARVAKLEASLADLPSEPAPEPEPEPPVVIPPASGVLLNLNVPTGETFNTDKLVAYGKAVTYQGVQCMEMRQFAELRWDGLPATPRQIVDVECLFPKSHIRTKKNDKLFRIWGGGYEEGQADIKVGASSWDKSIGVEYHMRQGSLLWDMGQGDPPQPITPFFIPANQDRWLRLTFVASIASSKGNDGRAEVWLDGKYFIGSTTLKNYPPSAQRKTGFTAGYFLGASGVENPPVTGSVYVRRLTISTGGFAGL